MSTPRQIFEAAEKGVEELKAIIERENIPVTIVNGAGQTLAHIAAKAGRVDVVKYVLEKEHRLLNKKDAYNVSVLHLAVVSGSLETVKYLVEEHKADVTYLGGLYSDRTALHAAVEFNRVEILKYFVEDRHIDFNTPHPKQTIPPIFLAAKNKSWEAIEYLVDQKNANVKLLNSSEENILFVIVRENYLGFMEYLLDEKKIDFEINWRNYYGETLVHVAASLGRIEILEYLVNKKNANINVRKRTDFRTPLHYAAFRNQFLACRFLVEHGADPRVQDTFGDIPADKARDPRLIDYLDYAAHTAVRRPRSVLSPYSSIESLPAPFELARQPSILSLPPQPAAYAVEGRESFPRSNVHVSYLQGFLFLAKSLIRSTSSERGIENSNSFSSPSSFVRSKMNSIAMDVIDGKTNFSKL